MGVLCVENGAFGMSYFCGKGALNLQFVICEAIPALKHLRWLPIEQRILFKVLLLAFKAMHDKSLTYMTKMLVTDTLLILCQ